MVGIGAALQDDVWVMFTACRFPLVKEEVVLRITYRLLVCKFLVVTVVFISDSVYSKK